MSNSGPHDVAQAMVAALASEWARSKETNLNRIKQLPSACAILQATPAIQVQVSVRILALLAELACQEKRKGNEEWFAASGFPWGCVYFESSLLKKALPFTEDDLLKMFGAVVETGFISASQFEFVAALVGALERHASANLISPKLSSLAKTVSDMLLARDRFATAGRLWPPDAADNAAGQRLARLLEGTPPASDLSGSPKEATEPGGPGPLPRLELYSGEAWSDAAIAHLKAMPAPQRAHWAQLLAHCHTASSGSPHAAWIKKADQFLKMLRWDRFKDATLKWFPLVSQPRTSPIDRRHGNEPDPNQLIIEPHALILKGMAWVCGLREDKEIARALTGLALSTYRKLPMKGPREVKIGNACVTALGMMPGMEGVYQLAVLKVKVKFGTAQKFIEKALSVAAARAGIRREELEEMAVPAYGLSDVGVGEEQMGDFKARLTVSGTTATELVWVKPDGKIQRSIPASVKEAHKEDLKELQAAAKDIQRMLPAQRERIDSLFLQQKTWPVPTWRERYLNHPLVGTLARRILWEFKQGDKTRTAIWFDGRLVDLDLRPVELKDAETTAQLWHPIGKSAEEVVAWRSWLDSQQVQQPFKQAHREIYLLTDAERNTRTYSNRYAAHVLKQHQFNALCALRGWKNKLRLMVNDEYPPASLHLPQWGLRAEFWIEGAGTDFGSDTNESGVFLHLSTDQVRFYRPDAAQRMVHAGGGGYHPGYQEVAGAEPVPLEEIPPLAFSEVMRDVDMFVGVASVGNDPAWSDGGPDGRYRRYWQDYSFGELSASAKTRKEVLERLVPKLKIASRCSFVDKFLVVKGSLRTYKVHLGSGNILMEPNDQYLCIVPRQSGEVEGKVLLPFEGDRTLSIVLSKAFLLADDAKIKDQSITHQIRQHK